MPGAGDGGGGPPGQLPPTDPIDEGRERPAGLAPRLEEAGARGDRHRGVVLSEAPEPTTDATLALTDAAADQDRVVGTLDPVVLLHRVTGQPDVADVVLPARVRAAADLDAEAPQAHREAVGRARVVEQRRADALGHPHRAGDGQRTVGHAGA